MIGVSKRATKRYCKVDPDFPGMSKCHSRYIDVLFADKDEPLLRRAHPDLKRCVNCWPREPGSRYARRHAEQDKEG